MDIPLEVTMARAIARKVIANPREFGVPQAEIGRLAIFVSERWEEAWEKTHYKEWRGSYYWAPIEDRLPAILKKLDCTENV